jgi:hypothetical protein
MKNMFLVMLTCILFTSYSCKKDTATYEIVFKKDTTLVNNCGCDAGLIVHFQDAKAKVIFTADSSFWRQDIIDAIVYDSDSVLFTWVKKNGCMIGKGRICNSQELVPYFDINSNAEYKVKISGKEFESCFPEFAPATLSYADILVTELKLLK